MARGDSVGVCLAEARKGERRGEHPRGMAAACSVVSEMRVTKVQPPRPAALPRQQAQPAERWSATESTSAAEVRRQRRMLAARFVAASVGVDTVPTVVMGRPSVVIVVVTDGDQLAMRFTSKRGWSGKSRPEVRMTSIHGAPARFCRRRGPEAGRSSWFAAYRHA